MTFLEIIGVACLAAGIWCGSAALFVRNVFIRQD